MVSIQVLATPIRGLRRSASVKPIALNMERAGARSRPSVMPRLRCLRSMRLRIHGERLQQRWCELRLRRWRKQEPRSLALLGMTNGQWCSDGNPRFARDDNHALEKRGPAAGGCQESAFQPQVPNWHDAYPGS